jgi:hypothetical protein
MSDGERDPKLRGCGDDVAAYALGALNQSELDGFLRHLETCAICRDELASFEQVANTLPLSGPMHSASPDLRRRVMRAVESEPRASGSPADAAAPVRRPRARWRMPRRALALGTALAVAAAVVIGLEAGSSDNGGARIIPAQVTGQGRAELKLNRGHAELILHNFAPPPAGKVYEVWLQRGSAAPSPTSALFSVTAAGNGDVDVPGSLSGVTRVLVTPEPAGGSRVPTHPPVISAQLSRA